MNKKQYRRLRGLRWGGGRFLLRVADDHLLLCDYRTGFVENYKRFYFRDIEAIIVRKTIHWAAALVIWVFLALCFLIAAMGTEWKLASLILEGLCVAFILGQIIRGPTCRTIIQTAVQTDGLPMLKRVRKTYRILAELIPLIETVQGEYPLSMTRHSRSSGGDRRH